MSYKRMNGSTEIIARQGYSGLGFGLDDITGAFKGALNFYGQSEQAKGAAAAAQQIAIAQAQAAQQQAQKSSGMPGWLLPVAIGGGLIALLVLRKK